MRAGTPNTTAFPTVQMKKRRVPPGCVWALLLICTASAAPPVYAQRKLPPQFQMLRRQETAEKKETEEAQLEAPGPTAPSPPEALDRLIDRSTYRLGPGDRVTIGVWGTTNRAFDLEVTPEGDLLVPAVGPVRVAGLTLAQAEQRVVAAAESAYQNARLTLSLVSLRTFRVHVSGLVTRPGTYTATPADRVSSVIERAGGLLDDSSRRRIGVRRREASVPLVDLELFYATGDTSLNPSVEMGDVVHVPVRGDSIAIWGAVKDPGYYEYRPGDTMSSLLRLAGGYAEDAQPERAEWSSFPVDSGPAVLRVVDLTQALGTPLDSTIRPGDRLLIHSLPEWRVRQSVEIRGEVSFPGMYSIVEGRTRLSDIVRRAGGPTQKASLRNSRLLRRQAWRTPDSEFERLSKMLVTEMRPEEYAYFKVRSREGRGGVALDFRKALNDRGSIDDVLLVDQDLIIVARVTETVDIAGQVNRPGLIPLQEGKTVAFYLEQAGGVSWNANTPGIRVIKANTGIWVRPRDDMVLEAGDTIFVPDKVPRDWWEIFKEGLLVTSQIATTIFIIKSVSGY